MTYRPLTCLPLAELKVLSACIPPHITLQWASLDIYIRAPLLMKLCLLTLSLEAPRIVPGVQTLILPLKFNRFRAKCRLPTSPRPPSTDSVSVMLLPARALATRCALPDSIRPGRATEQLSQQWLLAVPSVTPVRLPKAP